MTPILLRTFRIGDLQVSECAEPDSVEISLPDGACRLTEAQWQKLHEISTSFRQYGDFVNFQALPKQAELPLDLTDFHL